MADPSIFYRLLRPILRLRGMEVVPIARHEKKGFFTPALERECKRGQPATVIDVGASDGRWSVEAAKTFPRALYHLIEPLAERKQALTDLCSVKPNFSYTEAAAAQQVGSGFLQVSEDLDGSALCHGLGKSSGRPVKLTTIDNEVQTCGLEPPYFIKLDTHGFERPILEGASSTLDKTALCIIEVYNYELFEGACRFGELNAFMEGKGFRCSDIVNLVWRPGDEMLWQFDMLFKPASSIEFSRNTYH